MASIGRKEMESLTRLCRTKAEKIRALAYASVPPAEIARFLGVRYQYAYNVLKRSKRADNTINDTPAIASESDKATLDSFGRVVLPEHFRTALGLSAGDELLLRLEGNEIRLFTRAAGLRLAQGIAGKYLSPGERLSDELISDRRREARESRG